MNWKSILGDVAPILGTVLGGPAGAAVGGLVAKVLGVGHTQDDLAAALKNNPQLIEKIKELEITQQTQFAQLNQELQKGQLAVNLQEAQSKSLFVAGWRPFVGWGTGLAFLLSAGVVPLAEAISAIAGYIPPHGWPPLNLSAMTTVLMGMLGLGAMRSVEKFKGKSNGV